ncbi:hypothetical protein ABIA39_005766 [Nocardia sp. GAS34]
MGDSLPQYPVSRRADPDPSFHARARRAAVIVSAAGEFVIRGHER